MDIDNTELIQYVCNLIQDNHGIEQPDEQFPHATLHLSRKHIKNILEGISSLDLNFHYNDTDTSDYSTKGVF